MRAIFRTCMPCIVIACIVLMTCQAVAQDEAETAEPVGGWYGSLSGLYVMPQDVKGTIFALAGSSPIEVEATIGFKNSFGLAVAAGYMFQQFRTELEVSYRRLTFDDVTVEVLGVTAKESLDAHINTTSLMANGYYDLTVVGSLKSYFGAGVGMAHHRGEGDKDTEFAYQAMIGVSHDLTERLALFGGYRYRGFTGDFDDLKTHNIEAGLRIRF